MRITIIEGITILSAPTRSSTASEQTTDQTVDSAASILQLAQEQHHKQGCERKVQSLGAEEDHAAQQTAEQGAACRSEPDRDSSIVAIPLFSVDLRQTHTAGHFIGQAPQIDGSSGRVRVVGLHNGIELLFA